MSKWVELSWVVIFGLVCLGDLVVNAVTRTHGHADCAEACGPAGLRSYRPGAGCERSQCECGAKP